MSVLDSTDNLLVVLGEECAEVAHRAAKAIRFGLDDIQAGQSADNRARLVDEISDLFAVVEMLIEIGALPVSAGCDPEKINAKKAKVQKYVAYSIGVGRM